MGKKKTIKQEPGEEAVEDSTQLETSNVLDATGRSEKEEYEALCEYLNAIAQPLAPRKLAKKLYKLIKKSTKEKHHMRQGVTEVQRAIRKGETGLVVLAGNVTPIDIYAHIPSVCEEKELPYVFTPSKEHLGLAAGHKRSSIMMLIKKHESYAELFDECAALIKQLPIPLQA